MKQNKHLQQGMTLIEILIALVIGLVLMAGVISLMISSKRAYNVQSDLAGLQENARFVVDFITKDARMAGYQGCSGGLPLAVQGLNNQAISGWTSDITSDVLMISFADTSRNAFAIMHCPPFEVYGQSFGLTSVAYQAVCPPVGNANFPAPTPLMDERTTFAFDSTVAPTFADCNKTLAGTACFGVGGDLRIGDTVVVSDCNGSDRYQVGNVGFTGGRLTSVTLATGLTRNYFNGGQSYGSEMRRLVTHRYYVAGVNGRSVICRDTLALNAALMCDIANGAEVLVEGVENMQLRYLVNTGSATNPNFQYVRASGNINWDLVRGIRVTLLMQTTESRNDRDVVTQTYSLDEEDYPNYTPTDLNRLRRVFSNTVMLRNRS
jgi:type IV pilus assembly protein PilW